MKPAKYPQDWQTRKELFDRLHRAFRFTIDAFASPENALLPRYWTEKDNALSMWWRGERVFANPPFAEIPAKVPNLARTADLALVIVSLNNLTRKAFFNNPPNYLYIPNARVKFHRPGGKNAPKEGSCFLLWSKDKGKPPHLADCNAFRFLERPDSGRNDY